MKIQSITFFGLILLTPSLFASSVQYCEDLSKKLYEYTDVETAYQDLILKARRLATQKAFSQEFEKYQPDYFNKDEIIDSILPLVIFDDVKKSAPDANNAFNICIHLENIRPRSSSDTERFIPKKIAEVCHFNTEYIDNKLNEINNAFIKKLQSGDISPPIKNMLNDADNIKPQSHTQLNKFTTVKSIDTSAGYISDTYCKALYVNPIDLYIASSPRTISSSISVLPPVGAKDDAGNEAEFQIVIINRDYNWKKGSNNIVEKKGIETKSFLNTFKNPRFLELSRKHLKDIASLGMASCEGDKNRENKRARERAKTVLGWVQSAFTDEDRINIYGINLGKHRFRGKKCDSISNEISISQRSIILVGILKGSDENIELSQAIYNALHKVSLNQPEKLPTNPKDYLKFEILENSNTSEKKSSSSH